MKALNEVWDTLNREDREAIAVIAGTEHVIHGWEWNQMSEETQTALIEADKSMRED